MKCTELDSVEKAAAWLLGASQPRVTGFPESPTPTPIYFPTVTCSLLCAQP